MDPEAFALLGAFDRAGKRATELALEAARGSFQQGRIPIAGAAVALEPDGSLRTIATGVNGRVPAAPGGAGYPTDHGETAAVRNIDAFASVDWGRVVFATTLSPCIMCARTLEHLHGLGLDKLVIAESKNFPGERERLADLPGMTIVELSDIETVERMRHFAAAEPRVWSADIGALELEGPPAPATGLLERADACELFLDAVEAVRGEAPVAAGIVAPVSANRPASDRDTASDGNSGSDKGTAEVGEPLHLLACCSDARLESGGNPTRAAAIAAMGLAGSSLNLAGAALVLAVAPEAPTLDLDTFGLASLGACELFHPAALLTNVPLTTDLDAALATAIPRRAVHRTAHR